MLEIIFIFAIIFLYNNKNEKQIFPKDKKFIINNCTCVYVYRVTRDKS